MGLSIVYCKALQKKFGFPNPSLSIITTIDSANNSPNFAHCEQADKMSGPAAKKIGKPIWIKELSRE